MNKLSRYLVLLYLWYKNHYKNIYKIRTYSFHLTFGKFIVWSNTCIGTVSCVLLDCVSSSFPQKDAQEQSRRSKTDKKTNFKISFLRRLIELRILDSRVVDLLHERLHHAPDRIELLESDVGLVKLTVIRLAVDDPVHKIRNALLRIVLQAARSCLHTITQHEDHLLLCERLHTFVVKVCHILRISAVIEILRKEI